MLQTKNYQFWFCTGSQDLYGDECLAKVAEHSHKIVDALNASGVLPYEVVWKPTLITNELIRRTFNEANLDENCAGVITWMHTFSPAKSWILGLQEYRKPLLHFHTQFNEELPYDTIDMDFMNENQSAHGDREYGHIVSRMRMERKVVVGHWSDPVVQGKLASWMRTAVGVVESSHIRVMRVADNMRNVAVTEGDKVEAQIKFGWEVDAYPVNEIAESVDAVSKSDVNALVDEYYEKYNILLEGRDPGEFRKHVAVQAQIELGFERFLEEKNYQAIVTHFGDLGALKQLPGLAIQRLMEKGYGFGAEGDWKVAAMVRLMKIMTGGVKDAKGTSMLEDYTYNLVKGKEGILEAHMLEICPTIADGPISIKCQPLSMPCILAATSGDTGKAAMAGFADVPQTCIQVYYPKDGVSPVQERQMVTQEGENVDVRAVIGNFDDAQAGVKRIFSDEAVRAELDKRGYFLSSANSINWGRILPQVVYYISAYCDLVRDGALAMGDKVNFCVPTGNFGDILAAYYAKRMGLPVNKLICASNSNNVLTDFLRTGIYDRNRPFHTTISPSMDILISSNLERLLFDLSGENDAEIRMYMDALGSAGRYQVSDNIKAKLDDAFWGGCCSEEETEETIRRYWQDHNYLIDPHTAVAAEVLAQYRAASGDETPAVEVSTASPYKFCGSVLTAIGETPCGDGLELLDQLHAVSGVPVPCRLAELKRKSRRFDKTVEKQAMEQAVLDFLK